uniref:Auxin-responsive protein n=1 Tax=Oryza glumipatula TaxID=40148 RepID=A0A0E0B629_9ORYZ
MIHSKKLAQLARKLQRVKTATAREDDDAGCTSTTSPVADKGHCAVYTSDGARFEVPLAYLGTAVLGELLTMSREEYGFSGDGKITLPCDAMVMEYVLCLLGRNASAEVEKAFLSSMVMPCHYASCVTPSLGACQQVAVCSN